MRSILKHAILQHGAIALSVAALGFAACQSDNGGDEDDGSGASGAASPTSSTGGSGGSGASGGSSTTGGSGGGIVECEGPEVTIQEITSGGVADGDKVSLTGVVAMSQKFLVSKSSQDSCLWGVFVSAPGLTETAPNTGLLIMSYGFDAEVPPGGSQTFCPRLGQDPAGDRIPDNVKPGDVLDVVGRVDRFPDPPNCSAPNPPNMVGMLQLTQVCQATITGTATPPEAKVLTPTEIAEISSTDNQSFHDQWAGVKVRLENVTVEPQNGMAVGQFGDIVLTNGVTVGSKIYYRGYSNNLCHDSPVVTDPNANFTFIEGFHYLSFCTWGLQVNDKCADMSPSSEDCTGLTCPPDTL